MKRIIVTGAAGFLGSHLCDKLLERGNHVIGIDNFFRGTKSNLPTDHDNFKFFECDCLDLETLKKIFLTIKPEIVIHYAAINGTRYFYDIPFKVCDENIRMTQNVLACCGSYVEKIIYASSSEVYGPTPNVPTKESEPIELFTQFARDSYASSKAMGEFLVKLWCEANKVKHLIIRPFNTYGPRMATNGYGQVIPEFIERVISGENFYMYGDGKQTRSFCYVTDHAYAVTELMENADNEIVNVGFDEEITIEDLALIIHNIMGREFRAEYKAAWKNDTKWRKPSLSKLKKYIFCNNFISLEDGIIKMLNY